jgi:hypothetical protein
MPDFNRDEYMTSYVPLCQELNMNRGAHYENGDQFWLDGVRVVHPGIPLVPQGAVWLPSIFDWLELLQMAGHTGIAFENVTTPAGDPGWNVYPIGNRDDFGAGITREIALARLWKQVTGA